MSTAIILSGRLIMILYLVSAGRKAVTLLVVSARAISRESPVLWKLDLRLCTVQ